MTIYVLLDSGSVIGESEIIDYLNNGVPVGSITTDKTGTTLKTCDPNDKGRCKEIHLEKETINAETGYDEICRNFYAMKYTSTRGAGRFTPDIIRCASCAVFFDASACHLSYCKECGSKLRKKPEFREKQNAYQRKRRENEDVRLKDNAYQRKYYADMSEEAKKKRQDIKNKWSKELYKNDPVFREKLREYNRLYAAKRRAKQKSIQEKES
jgi:hypothetical protein